jgi:hypothetical protein
MAFESKRKGKEALGNRRHRRHTGRLCIEEIETLKVVMCLVMSKK